MMLRKYSSKVIQSSLFLILLLFISIKCLGQRDTAFKNRNAIFYEIGGNGGAHSLNYERAFNIKNQVACGLRIGAGISNIIDYNGKINPNVILPLLAGLMVGDRHKMELGIGQTFSNTVESSASTGKPIRRSNLSTTFNIGYRYQNPRTGFLFRCGYTPYIEFNERYKHWAGISFGYIF